MDKSKITEISDCNGHNNDLAQWFCVDCECGEAIEEFISIDGSAAHSSYEDTPVDKLLSEEWTSIGWFCACCNRSLDGEETMRIIHWQEQ